MKSEKKIEARTDVSAKFDERVDLSLLRASLRRSHAQRLEYAVGASNNLRKMVEYARRSK
jgi:hypothetical protein